MINERIRCLKQKGWEHLIQGEVEKEEEWKEKIRIAKENSLKSKLNLKKVDSDVINEKSFDNKDLALRAHSEKIAEQINSLKNSQDLTINQLSSQGSDIQDLKNYLKDLSNLLQNFNQPARCTARLSPVSTAGLQKRTFIASQAWKRKFLKTLGYRRKFS